MRVGQRVGVGQFDEAGPHLGGERPGGGRRGDGEGSDGSVSQALPLVLLLHLQGPITDPGHVSHTPTAVQSPPVLLNSDSISAATSTTPAGGHGLASGLDRLPHILHLSRLLKARRQVGRLNNSSLGPPRRRFPTGIPQLVPAAGPLVVISGPTFQVPGVSLVLSLVSLVSLMPVMPVIPLVPLVSAVVPPTATAATCVWR